MPREFEAKFVNINVTAMKKKLLSIGAKQVHKPTLYYRVQFKRCIGSDSDNNEKEKEEKKSNGFVRVRKEGEKTTMTTKIFSSDKKFPEEYEVTITEPYEKGVKFLESIGLEKTSEQETMREKWSHPLAHEITFDIVPGLPIYMEVDCTSEDKLKELISLLDLNKEDMRYGSFDKVFTEYYAIPNETIIHKTPSLSFKDIERETTPIKNRELFKKISSWNKRISQLGENTKDEMDQLYDEYDKKIYQPFLVSRPDSVYKSVDKQEAGRKTKKHNHKQSGKHNHKQIHSQKAGRKRRKERKERRTEKNHHSKKNI